MWVQIVDDALKDFAVMCGYRAEELVFATCIHQDTRLNVVMNIARANTHRTSRPQLVASALAVEGKY